MNTQNKSFAEKYLNVITSNGAVSIITKPTRVTVKTATVIDHIITNDISHKIIPRVMYSSITDHFLSACKVSQLNLFSRKMNTFFYHDKRKFCSRTYCEEMYSKLANIVLSNFPFQRDKLNDVFEMFVTAIFDTIEKHAPQTRLSRKQARLAKKPWITNGIFSSVKRKNSMFRSQYINGNVNEKRFFRKYTNILTELKALSKKIHFRSEINKNKSNARKTWDIIRSVLPNKLNRESPSSLKIKVHSQLPCRISCIFFPLYRVYFIIYVSCWSTSD